MRSRWRRRWWVIPLLTAAFTAPLAPTTRTVTYQTYHADKSHRGSDRNDRDNEWRLRALGAFDAFEVGWAVPVRTGAGACGVVLVVVLRTGSCTGTIEEEEG